MTSWSNLPSSHDGYAGGRSIVVTAYVSAAVQRVKRKFVHYLNVRVLDEWLTFQHLFATSIFPSHSSKNMHSDNQMHGRSFPAFYS